MWKMEDGNFISGAVIIGNRQDFPAFDDIEIEIVKKLNLEDLNLTCVYCESTVIRSVDRRRYECTMCGACWEGLY
jgi:ferredoxin